MLSRSSLETQKLELMSAISELKLQQASLERENLELRSSHMNNNSSDGTIKSNYLSRMSPQPQLTSTPVHHGSNQVSFMSKVNFWFIFSQKYENILLKLQFKTYKSTYYLFLIIYQIPKGAQRQNDAITKSGCIIHLIQLPKKNRDYNALATRSTTS